MPVCHRYGHKGLIARLHPGICIFLDIEQIFSCVANVRSAFRQSMSEAVATTVLYYVSHGVAAATDTDARAALGDRLREIRDIRDRRARCLLAQTRFRPSALTPTITRRAEEGRRGCWDFQSDSFKGWNGLDRGRGRIVCQRRKDPAARSKSMMSEGFTIFLGAAECAGALGVMAGALTQWAAMLILVMRGAIQKKFFCCMGGSKMAELGCVFGVVTGGGASRASSSKVLACSGHEARSLARQLRWRPKTAPRKTSNISSKPTRRSPAAESRWCLRKFR